MDSKIGFEMNLIVVEAIRGRCASFTVLTATVSEIFGGQTTPSILVLQIIGTVAFTFIKLQPRLDSKRNRSRWRRVKIITKHCLLFIRSERQTVFAQQNCFKYHYHASTYSLQTVCCRFIYLHEENANADDMDNSTRLPG